MRFLSFYYYYHYCLDVVPPFCTHPPPQHNCTQVFYFFAIFGYIIFHVNDPWHFGNLHLSMLTLYRCATLEDWTDVMCESRTSVLNLFFATLKDVPPHYLLTFTAAPLSLCGIDINMYGCDMYGYDSEPSMVKLCTQPEAKGYLAAVYFMLVTVINALILLNLFIGVISTSMEEATQEMEKEALVDQKVANMVKKVNLTPQTVHLYRQVFEMLDQDASGQITVDELKDGLDATGLTVTADMLFKTMEVIDTSGDAEIDFAEFLDFMHYVRDAKEYGRVATLKTVLQGSFEDSAGSMLGPLRKELQASRSDPYFTYVGQQLLNELKEYGHRGAEEPQTQHAQNAQFILTCAGRLEAFLRDNRSAAFHGPGMRFLSRMKRLKAKELQFANPNRLGEDDLTVMPSQSCRRDKAHFQVYSGIDKLPKVLV